MKIALALLALLGISNAQRIPLVDEIIRGVSDEIIYDDSPLRERVLKHAEVSAPIPIVAEVIRRGSEEIIYSDATISSQGTVQHADVSANGGMHHRHLAPVPLLSGHEKASLTGVPKNATKRSTHFKDPSKQQRSRRHRSLLDVAAERDPAEEVRVLIGYANVDGKTLIDQTANIVYYYIDEVNIVSAMLTWAQVAPLVTDPSIEYVYWCY